MKAYPSREELNRHFSVASDAFYFLSRDDVAPHINYVDFSKMSISSAQFNVIATKCKKNYDLIVPLSDLSTADFSLLNDMPNLRELNLQGCVLPDSGLMNLSAVIYRLNIAFCMPSPQIMPPLPRIERVTLGGISQMTQSFLSTVKCGHVTFKGLGEIDVSNYSGPALVLGLDNLLATVTVKNYRMQFDKPNLPLTMDPEVTSVLGLRYPY